ncbi:hypothetical protein [Acinetobacter sp. BY419]|nr:hypothetical protein [Acinetobacter sp. BY419]
MQHLPQPANEKLKAKQVLKYILAGVCVYALGLVTLAQLFITTL